MRSLWVIVAGLLTSCAWSSGNKMPWTCEPVAAPARPLTPKGQGGELLDAPAMSPAQLQIADDGYAGNDVGALPLANETLELTWPISPTGVNSLYGERRDPVDGSERFHAGVDLDAEYGSTVYASAAGVVSYAGWNRGHGRQVIIEHAAGYQTIYSHLSQVLVFPGYNLAAGAPIGRVGNSGRSTGPHLHLEITHYGEHLDPLDLLGHTVRLR